MSAAFTPGPWSASVEKRPAPGRGYWYVVLDAEENGLGEFYGSDHETNAANLRLAAAAPDLYDGCNALLGLVQLLAANPETPPALLRILTESHRIAEAEAAVAKAQGVSGND